MHRGIATLELLIALGVLTLILSGIVIISFGNQVIALDTGVRTDAFYSTRNVLEKSVTAVENGNTPTTTMEGLFSFEIETDPISECLTRTKVSSSWWKDNLRTQSLFLETVIAHEEQFNALDGDCDTWSFNIDEWDNPSIATVDLISGVSDLDVMRRGNQIYAFITSTNFATETPDILIVRVTDPHNPSLTDTPFDFDPFIFPVSVIDVIGGYAFIGTDDRNFQLHVLGMEDPENPGPYISASGLPGVDPYGESPGAESIFYHDKRLYVGTRRTAGHEFHIFDADPSIIGEDPPVHIGSTDMNHGVLDLFVRGDSAYISSSATTDWGCELIVLDISKPDSITNPCYPTSENDFIYRAPGTFDGESVFVGFDSVVVGRKRAKDDGDFHILDTSDLKNIVSTGSSNINLSSGDDFISGVARRGEVLVTSVDGGEGIQIWNVSNEESPVREKNIDIAGNVVAMEIFEGVIYAIRESPPALLVIAP